VHHSAASDAPKAEPVLSIFDLEGLKDVPVVSNSVNYAEPLQYSLVTKTLKDVLVVLHWPTPASDDQLALPCRNSSTLYLNVLESSLRVYFELW